jgi:Domain of unknown function (DUF4126)
MLFATRTKVNGRLGDDRSGPTWHLDPSYGSITPGSWATQKLSANRPSVFGLAYGATAQLSPATNLVCTTLGGLIALAAHGGKTAVRAAVHASPEPFSNIALSFGEDGLAVFLTWLATQHPYTAAALGLLGVVVIILLLRLVIHSIRTLFHEAAHSLESD